MVYVIILSAVATIIVIINATSLENYIPPKKIVRVFFFIGILLLIIGVIIGVISLPSALDVYRGKTQLKITETTLSNKVIKRDSIVVYK